MSDNPNPGNFANRPQEEVENIARKGGQSSHQGGFASMDPNKQVSKSVHYMTYYSWHLFKRNIASEGGHASSGSFQPGDERAKEAGRKGGQSSGQPDE
jgi:general stress protein YciG